MKKFMTVLAIAAAAAPAFAQTQQTQQTTISHQALAAQAYAPHPLTYGDPSLVVLNGRIVGRDPDVSIRAQLLRDPKPDAP